MSKRSVKSRRQRKFEQLERKAFVGVIGIMVFGLLVVVIVVHFGLNEHVR